MLTERRLLKYLADDKDDWMDQQSIASDETSNSEGSSHRPTEFEKAFQENRGRIYRFLLASSRDPDLAEVLTQECFLKAFRNWSSFRGDAQVSTWLMRIAINLQKSHWRSRGIQFWRQKLHDTPDGNDILWQLPDGRESPERSAIAKQQVARLWNAVSRLSRREKTVFLLKIVDELKVKEIADITGISEGTVKSHLYRSIKKIREALCC